MSGMLINLFIQIVSGAIGGNVVGAASKDFSLGTLGNTIAGAIGGGVGGQVLAALIPALSQSTGSVDVGSLIGQVASGGVAGAALTGIVGMIKSKMS
jgi:hypothetical protein